jgi:hypothetical protein
MIINSATYDGSITTKSKVSQKSYDIKIFTILLFAGLSLLALILLIVWLTRGGTDDGGVSNNTSQSNYVDNELLDKTGKNSENDSSETNESQHPSGFNEPAKEPSSRNGEGEDEEVISPQPLEDNEEEMRSIMLKDLSSMLLGEGSKDEHHSSIFPDKDSKLSEKAIEIQIISSEAMPTIKPSWIPKIPEWVINCARDRRPGWDQLIIMHFLVMCYQPEHYDDIMMRTLQYIMHKNIVDIYMGNEDDEQPHKISPMSVEGINQEYKKNKAICAIIDTKDNLVYKIGKHENSWKIPDEEMRSIKLEDLSPILVDEGSRLSESAIKSQIILSEAMPQIKPSWIQKIPKWVIDYAKKAGQLRQIYIHMHFLVMRYQLEHYNDIMNALDNTHKSLQSVPSDKKANMYALMKKGRNDEKYIDLWETEEIHELYKQQWEIGHIGDRNLWSINFINNQAVFYHIPHED